MISAIESCRSIFPGVLFSKPRNSRGVEKAMAPHSSPLAWKIPWTEEPGRLQSMGSLRVGHDWATSLSLFTFTHWRGKCQPTPVFLPGESKGRGSLMGCHLWGRTESDTTEATQQQQQQRTLALWNVIDNYSFVSIWNRGFTLPSLAVFKPGHLANQPINT